MGKSNDYEILISARIVLAHNLLSLEIRDIPNDLFRVFLVRYTVGLFITGRLDRYQSWGNENNPTGK